MFSRFTGWSLFAALGIPLFACSSTTAEPAKAPVQQEATAEDLIRILANAFPQWNVVVNGERMSAYSKEDNVEMLRAEALYLDELPAATTIIALREAAGAKCRNRNKIAEGTTFTCVENGRVTKTTVILAQPEPEISMAITTIYSIAPLEPGEVRRKKARKPVKI